MVWSADNEQGGESLKIRHLAVPYTRGRGLDLGCGPWKVWPHAIGIDNYDEWTEITSWKPDVQTDCLDLSMFADRSMDFVFSSHVLEHVEDTEKTLREWFRVIEPGGHLILYLPDRTLYPNIGEEGSNPDHKHDFVADDIIEIMRRVGSWTLVENQRRDRNDEYSFFLVFRKEKGTKHEIALRPSSVRDGSRKTLLVVRYGGFGDMMQISSVLPFLKERGWYIVLNTSPNGWSVIREDPNIDEFWIQDKDQVPQGPHLEDYWSRMREEFDAELNLSEAVEGTLLAIPGRRDHALSHEARHLLMNANYIEFHHAMARVPFRPQPRFYPTKEEVRMAGRWRAVSAERPFILWALGGSSVHKKWPWVPEVVAWLLENTEARIMFVGDFLCAEMERAFMQNLLRHYGLLMDFGESNELPIDDMIRELGKIEKFKGRLICKSDRMSIRDTLAVAQVANLVIGPETGVLNAVSAEHAVKKIVLLSHSSENNLTRDWVRTTAIAPKNVECYPCHRLHYDRTYCPEDMATGAAKCAAAITPKEVVDAIRQALGIEVDLPCPSISQLSRAIDLLPGRSKTGSTTIQSIQS